MDCSALQDKATVSVIFGALLALGVLCSYVPQEIKIVRRRTSEGLSFLYLICASLQNYFSTLNVVLVQIAQFECCSSISFGKCQVCARRWVGQAWC